MPYTAYIDAVEHGRTTEETRKPPRQYHVNYYERIGDPIPIFGGVIRGNAVDGADFQLNVNTTDWGQNLTHTTIDDDVAGAGRIVLDGVRARLRGRVNR